jgi:exosortase
LNNNRQDSEYSIFSVLPGILIILLITIWSYWSTIFLLYKDWQGNDDYSAGQLVPLVAIFLVWHERKNLKKCTVKPCWIWGIVLLLTAQAGRFYGLLYMFESAERYSIVLAVAGLVLMITGIQVTKKVVWVLLFLLLMVPLPGRIHNIISGPLQSMATSGSVFVLEAFGVIISRQGNVVTLNRETTMAVEEACSGLRMLTAFIIVTAFIAYMIKRSKFQKAFLLFSSIPIAVVCNIIRLCITAVLFMLVSSQAAEKFFHDFAGLTMMPAAVLLIFGELWLLKILTVTEPKPQKNIIISTRKTAKNDK